MQDLSIAIIILVLMKNLMVFQTKESHLQDLLEAKALAVDQADRLISQYRCRRAQSEAEVSM
jgi:hypothetical protein